MLEEILVCLIGIYCSFLKYFFKGTLDAEWLWYRYEWQSRTAIYAHGVVKFRNQPGLANLVASGRLLYYKL